MAQIFNGCKKIKTLNLEHFDTSKINTWIDGGYYMFADCNSLEELKISSWNTSTWVSMIGMFQNCSSLKSLDIGNWNVDNVTRMDGMFQNCNNITTLDLSNWNISKCTGTSTMFRYNPKLKTIYVSEKWGDNSQVTDGGQCSLEILV